MDQRDTTIKTLKTQIVTPTKQLNTPNTAPQPSPSTPQPSNTQNLPITQQDHPEPPSETPKAPPKKDFHPATIQRVNADIARGCSLLPNMHLAHHSTITPYHLYDHVHLNKHMIKEFARTLKDVAQGRHSYSAQQHRVESLKPQHHRHRYAAISPVAYKHYLRARHLPGQRSPPQLSHCAPPTGHTHPPTPSRPALRPHPTTSACDILPPGLAQRPPPTRPAHQHQSGPTPRAAPVYQDSVLQQQRSYTEALQTQ
ncbi:hypothetical protein AOLI_G00036570 [Acnodon oligacanthus]